ncbi:transposase [Cypionkella sp.]|uniref:transposase n=1 Tax=Cypionkella sp. TaxID=2811411 RepID=UPI00351D1C9F
MHGGKLGHDPVQRQIPLGRQPLAKPATVRCRLARSMIALDLRSKAPGRALQNHHVVHEPRRLTMPMPLLDKAISLAGLAPVTRQSGQRPGKAFIQGGRAILRQAIYRPALVAIRFNPSLKATYNALRAAGKPAKLAMTTIMRRIITIANAQLRDGRKGTETMA